MEQTPGLDLREALKVEQVELPYLVERETLVEVMVSALHLSDQRDRWRRGRGAVSSRGWTRATGELISLIPCALQAVAVGSTDRRSTFRDFTVMVGCGVSGWHQ